MNEPLPDLNDALIDAATLWQLADDVETHTELLDVRQKGGASRRADTAPVELREAFRSLERGQLFGVQIAYRFQDVEWRDTLMKTPEGIRIVRMQMPVLS